MGRFLTPAGVQRLLLRKIYRARRHRQRCHSCPRREFVLHRKRSRPARQGLAASAALRTGTGAHARGQRLSLHSDFSYDAAQYTGR